MKSQLILLGILLVLGSASASPSCLSLHGEEVEFFLMRKLPNSTVFFYCDSASISCVSPTFPNFAFNDTERSPLFKTLRQISPSGTNSTLLGSLSWNNAPTEDDDIEDGAHAKGILGFDSQRGFVLSHSSPFLPNVANNTVQLGLNDDFNFENGNHYFCLSTNTSEINKLALGYQIDSLNIYQGKIPTHIQGVQNLRNLLAKNATNATTNQLWNVVSIQSIKGNQVNLISKSPAFNTSFFDNVLSPVLRKDLLVETGGEQINPSCKSTGSEFNVVSVELLAIGDYIVEQPQDNSKYAFSNDGSIFCSTDLDRQADQFVRGGSALCIYNSTVPIYMSHSVLEQQPCSSNNQTSFVQHKLRQQ